MNLQSRIYEGYSTNTKPLLLSNYYFLFFYYFLVIVIHSSKLHRLVINYVQYSKEYEAMYAAIFFFYLVV